MFSNYRSVGFKAVSVLSCVLIATPIVADGTHAAGGDAGPALSWAMSLLRLRQVQAAPHYTDTPRPIYRGASPSRDSMGRGGMWSTEKLLLLEKQEIENALQWGQPVPASILPLEMQEEVESLRGPLALAGGLPVLGGFAAPAARGLFGRSSGASEAGPAFHWERELGGANTNTGGKFFSFQLVSWPVRGGGSVDVTLHHSSKNTITTAFGHSWRMSYELRVVPTINQDEVETGANVYWGDGSVIPYTLSGSTYVAPAGVFDVLTRNADQSFKITKKDQSTWNTNTSGYLTSWKDRAGNTVNVARDGSNRITSVTDPANRQLTVSYNGSGYVSSITDPMSRVFSFSYTGSDLTSITYPILSGSTYSRTFGYNAGHDITSHVDLRGKTWTATYDSNGGLLSETTPLNHTTNYSYTSTSGTMTLPGGQASTDNYSSGRIASRVDPGSFSESITSYNSNNLPLSSTDKRGKVWSMTWDAQGNMLTKVNPLNKTWTMTYNSTNDMLTSKDPLNNQTTYTYHSGSGKVLTVTDPLSRAVETNTYNSYGERLTTKNAMNETFTYAYNTNGDLTSVTNPLNQVTSYGYNTLSRRTTVTDGLNQTWTTGYDNWMRATSVTKPGGAVKTTAYDREDNVTSVTDEDNHTTTWAFDDSGRNTSVTNAISNVESYAYNSNGWRTGVTNGRNYTRTYAYNSRGQVSSLTMPDSSVEQWSYNGNGEVSAYVNPLNQTINYSFDDASRQTGIDYPTGTDVTFGYDDADRRTSMVDSTGTTSWTYNAASEVTQLSTPQGTISYTYQTSGRRATMVETGVGTTTYGYDTAGRMTSLQNPFSETTSFQYDAAGRLTRRTLHSGAYTDIGYCCCLPTSVVHKKSDNSTISSESYVYSNAGNMTSKTVDGVTTTYTYDNADQLLSESRTGYSCSYTYDANGNRATRVLNGVTETYTNDSGDKLTSVTWTGGSKTYGYDAAGRTTSVVTSAGTTTLAYDYEGRITTITFPNSSTNTFQYNGLGTRTQKVESSGTKNFKRDGVDVTSAVINDSSANYTPGISERRSSTTTYSHSSPKNFDLQTTSSQSTSATRTYDAFGNLTNSIGTWNGPFGYGGPFGYQNDGDSGLLLLGHRYYDTSIGRFLTRDVAKDGRNWHAYCSSSPLTSVDADGKRTAHYPWGRGEFPDLTRLPDAVADADALCGDDGDGLVAQILKCRALNDQFTPCTFTNKYWNACGGPDGVKGNVSANKSAWPLPKPQWAGTDWGGENCCMECKMRVCCAMMAYYEKLRKTT